MKLRNKKTGEIVDLIEIVRIDNVSNEFYLRLSDNEGRTFKVGFNSLSELNEMWEDYEEPKEYWCIDWTEDGGIFKTKDEESNWDVFNKQIGNHFNTREEAEKAVEKLKAWKRLKDKGFRFTAWYGGSKNISYEITSLENETYIPRQICDDLDLLFCAEVENE